MDFKQTALLASIDQALAAAKAALAAGSDELAAEASSMIARLPTGPDDGWEEVPREAFEGIRSAHLALAEGDLEEGERRLEKARRALGGPSS